MPSLTCLLLKEKEEEGEGGGGGGGGDYHYFLQRYLYFIHTLFVLDIYVHFLITLNFRKEKMAAHPRERSSYVLHM